MASPTQVTASTCGYCGVGCAHRHHAKVESGRVLLAFAQRN